MALPAGTQWMGGIAVTPDGAVYVTPTGAATITSGTIDGVVIGGTTPGAITGTTITATTKFVAPAGLVSAPAILLNSTSGWYARTGTAWTFTDGASPKLEINGDFFVMGAGQTLGWSSSGIAGATDVSQVRAGANSFLYGAGTTATTTSRTEINKAVSAFSNTVAKTVFTVTIPNAAHHATLEVRVQGALGAGGAIGAGEAMATNTYLIAIVRTAGVATVATATAARDAVAVAVAGAATVTATAAVTAMSGAVGATQTFDVQVTITRSGGSSDNHTCLCYGKLLNANSTGITIA